MTLCLCIYFIAWKFRGMKISRFRSRVQKNREIKMPQKMHFELNREIRMPGKNF